MAAVIKIRKYRSLAEANFLISGGLVGGARVAEVSNYVFSELVGLTLTFTAPAGNKTFTQPAGRLPGQMSFQDVKTQLEAAIANLKVTLVEGSLAFYHSTAGTAVTLGSANEPARTILGFPNNQALAGVVLADPGGSAPKFLDMYPESGAIYITSQE